MTFHFFQRSSILHEGAKGALALALTFVGLPRYLAARSENNLAALAPSLLSTDDATPVSDHQKRTFHLFCHRHNHCYIRQALNY